MNPTVPDRFCDVVMKGGITSGIVYPLAIAELSQEFRFKNVGGTSAGAIAAALTAAAEYRRLSYAGSRAGFERLAALPAFLGGATGGQPNLLNLFPPAPEMRSLFGVALAFLRRGSGAARARRVAGALLRAVPLATVLAALLAAIPLAVFALAPTRSATGLLAFLYSEAMALVCGLLLVVALGVAALARRLPRNGFGFGTGMAPAGSTLPGVTDWLHATLQETAGRGAGDPPLTFGDLWTAGAPAGERDALVQRAAADPEARAIDLQMIATALTHGRPYRLPFESRTFYFDEQEMRGCFPAAVVDHLVAAAARIGAAEAHGKLRLPAGRDLPVVVAARLSLSFPLLFSMVPLYAVDYTRGENRDRAAAEAPRPERCWFVDGGLSSNFPVTLFDAPLPRWPTFCINLATFHADHPRDARDERNNVWVVKRRGDGTSERWLRLPPRGFPALGAYAAALLTTILEWHDGTQLAVPGYRDRIAHVKLGPDEGGLNLDMEAERVRSLAERGRFAGQALRERFGAIPPADPEALDWNTHRWTRLRSTMALLQDSLAQCAAALRYEDPAYPGYEELIARTADAGPHTGYWWHGRVADFQALLARFASLSDELGRAHVRFGDGAPLPRPELHITPRV